MRAFCPAVAATLRWGHQPRTVAMSPSQVVSRGGRRHQRFAEQAHALATVRGLTVPIHVQLALADFLETGGLRRHIRAMNAEYGARMAVLVETLRLDGLLTVPDGAGGLQLCVGWPNAPADTLAVAALQAAGIAAAAISPMCQVQQCNGLLLGVGLVQRHEVRAAATSMCRVLHRLIGGT